MTMAPPPHVLDIEGVDPLLLDLSLDVLLTEHLADAEGDELDNALWWRCGHDLEAFSLMFFPDRFGSAFNRLHNDIFAQRKVPWTYRTRAEYNATAAPRGSAKTTIRTFADLVHDVCYGFELFIGVISTSFDLSETLVSDLYDVFKDADAYPELHRMYGPFKVTGTKTSFVVKCPSANTPKGTKIKAYSMGGACRGHKHHGVRFTKWVLDDAERSDRVHNPNQRDKDESFVDSDVVRAGAEYTIVHFVGTVLHPDSVLARKLDPHKSPGWDKAFYSAILQWPDEVDGLWEECRAIWADLKRPTVLEREDAAWEFYAERKKAMDAGAEVLWPERESLFDLMIQWWTNRHSFSAEKQNEPGKSGERTYDVDRFHWVAFDGRTITTEDGREVPISKCKTAVWWDPIPYNLKQTGRDKAGFAAVARGPDGGRYVLEAAVERASPERQWERFLQFEDRYPHAKYGYENNTGDMEGNEDFQRMVRAIKQRNRRFKVKGHQTKGSKENRIADMQPACENGFIRFSRSGVSAEVVEQFRHFPDGRFDDGPDAIERAFWLLDQDHMPTISRRGA